MKRNRSRPGLKVTGGGASAVNHAGTRLLCDVAEAVGLIERLSDAMAATNSAAGDMTGAGCWSTWRC